MNKVLVLSYYCNPANFVACERIQSWAKDFKENDIYPIIVTRQWNEGQTDIIDPIKHNKLSIDNYIDYEVHRLPYTNSMRDKLASSTRFPIIRKSLSFLGLLAETIFFRLSKNYLFYSYSREYLRNNPDVKIIIASGRPFFLFKAASLLSVKNKINWIADYRDEWTTIYPKPKLSFLKKLLFSFDKVNEKKWISTSSFFVTTSENIKNRIERKFNKKGILVLNGFEEGIRTNIKRTPLSNKLKILYAGTLYSYQNIGLLIDSVKKFNLASNDYKIEVSYIGVSSNPVEFNQLKKMIKDDNSFHILPKIKKQELNKLYQKYDVLYLTSYEENKGWLPVKLFDYYQNSHPILLYPSDKDVMEEFIINSNSGTACSNYLEFENFINSVRENYNLNYKRNTSFGNFYSRKNQTKIFAAEINKMISSNKISH